MLLLVAARTAVAAGGRDATRCAQALAVRADGVQVWFAVELAISDEERARGLMGRRHLAPRQGMWFDFGRAQRVAMWMKNTPLPLDILFIAANGRLAGIHARATPGSLALLRAPVAVRYVLELGGGEAAALGLAPGDRLLLLPGRGQCVESRGETVQ